MLHLSFARRGKSASRKRLRKHQPSAKKWVTRRLFIEPLEARVVPSTLTTDRPAYAPGQTAMLELNGFQDAETVKLQVLRTDDHIGTRSATPMWTVSTDDPSADAAGGDNEAARVVYYTL